MSIFLYIGPQTVGAAGTVFLVIGGIVAVAIGYIVWFRVKQFLKRKKE